MLPLPGGNGVLTVTAFTLQAEVDGVKAYAALRNDGEEKACSAGFAVELFDAQDASVSGGIGGLLTQRFYRLTDAPDTIAACVGPGDVVMAAISLAEFPAGVAVDDVSYAVYRCPYFALDVTPTDAIRVTDVRVVSAGAGTTYSGKLVNELDVVLRNPSVTIYPLNAVGRPLGAVSARDSVEVPSGGRWSFETPAVSTSGVGYAAYPAGAFDE